VIIIRKTCMHSMNKARFFSGKHDGTFVSHYTLEVYISVRCVRKIILKVIIAKHIYSLK
jgi:hypothetical protein